jgi:group I intron endonuclease
MISGIYKISSTLKPERIYIGSSNNISKRWVTHKTTLNEGTHHSIKLQRHYNKYKNDVLKYEIIYQCSPDMLLIVEQYYLDLYKPYFNSLMTAGSSRGYKQSTATLKKHKEYKPTPETNEKISNALKGRVSPMKDRSLTQSHKDKIGLAGIGRIVSDETIQKLSNSNKGKHSGKRGKQKSRNWEVQQIKLFRENAKRAS